MALTPGTRIGSYEITAPIGVGGMGEVYRARDVNLGRDVAIKVLPDAFAQDADRLARFEREAKTLASLNHPNIAIIHGFDKSDGVRALVMEFVEGPTLADLIERRGGSSDPLGRALPLDEALPIAKQIAEALEAAHEQGIVHRDLKPANVKIRDDGTVKVLDFGLAKIVEASGQFATTSNAGSKEQDPAYTVSPTITTPAMTQIGVILGTAAYMAPEQARGKPVDKRSDIWAFGCVLFEMLAGTRAFDGEDTTDTIAAVVRAEPKWDALPRDVPDSIRLLLKRCLEKDRKKRIGDISTALFIMNEPVLRATENAADGSGAVARQTAPLWNRALHVLAGAVFAAAIVGAAMWMGRPTLSAPRVTRFSFPLPEGQQFTNTGRPLVAVSPDGSRIVYVANRRLYVRSMSESTPREIQGSEDPEGVTTPSFSPDGQWVVFVAAGERALKRISIDGGVAVTICPITGSLGVAWDPDGIVFGRRPGDTIFRVSPSGGAPQPILKVDNHEIAFGAQILPGGDALLVTMGTLAAATTANPDQIDNPRIVWHSLKSGERITLIEHGADGRFLPSGHIVYADSGALLAVRFDVARHRVIGDPIPVVRGVRRSNVTPAAQFSVSNDGVLAYVPGSGLVELSLALLDRQGGSEFLKVRSAGYNTPRLSPDGKQVAVEIGDGKLTNIWIYDTSGAHSIRQLTLDADNRFPVWSADSQRVAFSSNRGGDVGVWSQRADGSGAAERLTQPEKGTVHAPLSWHPKEPTLLYVVRRGLSDSGSSLWTYSLTEKKSKPFAGVQSERDMSGQFSPDGRWVAYHTGGGRSSVFVRPYPSTDAVYPVSNGVHPIWSADGAELFFARASSLYVTRVTTQPTFATSVPTAVTTTFWVPGPWRNFDTVDGKRFLAVVNGSSSETENGVTQQIDVVLNWFEEVKRLVPAK